MDSSSKLVRVRVDPCIRLAIQRGIQNRWRTMFLLVGDNGREQVAVLHHMMTKEHLHARPSVLWCYKDDLGFTSNQQKRRKQMQKLMDSGLLDAGPGDQQQQANASYRFDMFLLSADLTYVQYKESHRILGNTFKICVLQDYEAMTPNLLARTVETVEGGGLMILLLRTMSSLRTLHAMAMDYHSRLRTDSHQEVVGRFNERFLLSLATCEQCLVLNDELGVLPLSAKTRELFRSIESAQSEKEGSGDPKLGVSSTSQNHKKLVKKNVALLEGDSTASVDKDSHELKELQVSLADTQVVGQLVAKTKTVDQGRALLTFIESLSDKSLRTTVALTAARGRGKSAALGLALAAAIATGYSNIFVTSPSPDNLKTLFEFFFIGLDCLDYQEHTDYDILKSADGSMRNTVVRVHVYRDHRQTIQYISPDDTASLRQAELLLIDEAAAIPLPMVRKLLGPYLVFLSSTVHGYEGTGRSLSLKLLQQLRQNSTGKDGNVSESGSSSGISTGTGRVFREITLRTPIRYASSDPVESWLNQLLCLDVETQSAWANGQDKSSNVPHPNDCQLYCVSRDALFSYHELSESFLRKMMALYVSAHYKNSPNDLLLMSDAPAHRLFVLLGPSSSNGTVPEVLCVIQACLEGGIHTDTLNELAARGERSSGDVIPWIVSNQFQDSGFAEWTGVRIVRIAVHPYLQNMGYGSRALRLLVEYYQGLHMPLEGEYMVDPEERGYTSTASSSFTPQTSLPPLLARLDQRRPEPNVQWIGTAFGITPELFKFWSRISMVPLYIRQTKNEVTAEHSCIMIRGLHHWSLSTNISRDTDVKSNTSVDLESNSAIVDKESCSYWLSIYAHDFVRRWAVLLGTTFSTIAPSLAMSIYTSAASTPIVSEDSREKLDSWRPMDLRRLDAYVRGMIDYHVIVDLLPSVARRALISYESGSSGFTPASLVVLIGFGLQNREVDSVAAALNLEGHQVLSLLHRVIRRVVAIAESGEEKVLTPAAGDVAEVAIGPASDWTEQLKNADQPPSTITVARKRNREDDEQDRHRRSRLTELESRRTKQKNVSGGKDKKKHKTSKH